jgi:hypothetical protein
MGKGMLDAVPVKAIPPLLAALKIDTVSAL